MCPNYKYSDIFPKVKTFYICQSHTCSRIFNIQGSAPNDYYTASWLSKAGWVGFDPIQSVGRERSLLDLYAETLNHIKK